MLRPRNLHVLVDWNSQLLAFARPDTGNSAQVARRILKRICRDLGKHLQNKAKDQPFFIHLRLYHGWRRGFEPTPNRLAAEEARVYDPTSLQAGGLNEYSPTRLHIVRDMQFGDRLLAVTDKWLCGPKRDHHLPGTLQRDRNYNNEEKMVDTAIVSDLIHLASENDDSWMVVISEDSDMLPGLMHAESIINGTGRQVACITKSRYSGKNPKAGELIW